MKYGLSFVVSFLFIGNAVAGEYAGPSITGDFSADASQYCLEDDTLIPFPNYKNPKVQAAAKVLSGVADISYYLYPGPLRAYGLDSKGFAYKGQKNKKDPRIPKTIKYNAHNFLTVLCGEFRDRPTMIDAKLGWVKNLYKLPTKPQIKKIDYTQSIWEQTSAHSYAPYLAYSQALYQARREKVDEFDVDGIEETLENPVPAQTVCETNYIIGQVIANSKDADFPGLKEHESELKKFSEKNCTPNDEDYYYDFRGDSNFKPNSPESNGMIWYSTSIANQCQTPTRAKSSAKGITDAECKAYFSKPFANRWNAARAGLATWLFRDTKHDSVFSSEGQSVYILPQIGKLNSPFPFQIDGTKYSNYLDGWNQSASWTRSDLGFNQYMGQNAKGGETKYSNFVLAYKRLRDAVNRHTDWYSSGYDDGMGTVKDQAYSPFVASSYEMSASDGFTAPGATVQSPSDGRKHWMFVFRVHKDNWYNIERLSAGHPVDFDRMWFDETTFGTNELAKSERAWDRLGTALEHELDSIIYLHNITVGGGVQAE